MPSVTACGDRLIYAVESRSRDGKHHRVDMEKRNGLGLCSCEASSFGRRECWHLTQVRKFMAVQLSQGIMEIELAK